MIEILLLCYLSDPSRMKEQEAIEKVRQEQKKHREADLRPQAGIKVSENFPVVHPNLEEVTFYQGGARVVIVFLPCCVSQAHKWQPTLACQVLGFGWVRLFPDQLVSLRVHPP